MERDVKTLYGIHEEQVVAACRCLWCRPGPLKENWGAQNTFRNSLVFLLGLESDGLVIRLSGDSPKLMMAKWDRVGQMTQGRVLNHTLGE